MAHRARRIFICGWLLAALSSAHVPGQQLARKNWEGSGLTVQTWWSHAIVCAAGNDLNRAAAQMDALERVGCDAVEVAPGSFAATPSMDALAEATGTWHIRILVDLTGPDDALLPAIAFWSARGAAGFALSGDVSPKVRQAVGARLLIADSAAAQLHPRRLPNADSAILRDWLATNATPGAILEDSQPTTTLPRAAMLLLSGTAARIPIDAAAHATAPPAQDYSQEDLRLWVPKQPLLTVSTTDPIRSLTELHHHIASTRQPIPLPLATPEAIAWALPARDNRTATLVVCNLSAKPLHLSLTSAVRSAGLKGTLLKPLLPGESNPNLENIDLPPDAVFATELR